MVKVEKIHLIALGTRIKKKRAGVKARIEEIELMEMELEERIKMWTPPNERLSRVVEAREELRKLVGLTTNHEKAMEKLEDVNKK